MARAMKYISTFLIVCVLFLGGFGTPSVAETLTLTDSTDIRDAEELDSALDDVSSSVTACMEGGKGNTQCQCENIDIIYDFNNLYKETVVRHPNWIGQAIYYTKPSGQGVTIMFSALQRQSEAIDDLVCE